MQVLTDVLKNLSYVRPVGVAFHERPPDGMPVDAVNPDKDGQLEQDTMPDAPRSAAKQTLLWDGATKMEEGAGDYGS